MRENGNQSHGLELASTGGLMPFGGDSSARQEPSEVGGDGDPKEDDAGFLFGPAGEEEPEAKGSIATLAGPTVVSGVIESDRARVIREND